MRGPCIALAGTRPGTPRAGRSFELFRCFHGAPRATGPTGREVGAARALLATFTSLVADPDVTHVAVAFDSVIAPPGSERGRTPDDLLASQAPLAAEVVRALGLVLWPAGRFQADELLATGAARFGAAEGVERVVLCTTDLDLACALAERRREARLARNLLTLRTDVPLVEEHVDELAWPGARRDLLDRLVAVLGEATAVERIRRWHA